MNKSMMTWIIHPWVVSATCLTILASGCGQQAPTAQADIFTVSGVIDGIAYTVVGDKPGTAEESEEMVTVTCGVRQLKIMRKEGRLVCRGKDCGTVKTGDQVVLSYKGRLSVNQIVRLDIFE